MARAGGHARSVQVEERLATRSIRLLASPAVALTLALLAMAFFWPVVVLHRVLLPGDVLYVHDPLWQALSPHPVTVPANGLDSDALTEFYPWTALASAALHRGVVPLWNPYSFAGTPFLGAMQTAVLYPVNAILEWLLSPADVLGARSITHLAVTLVGAFFFARRLALSRPAAALAALAFGLGLPYVVWLEHPMSGAVAWLPWLLLCIDRIVATRASLRWVLAGAAVLALELLAGHGESTAHALLLCIAYAFFRVGRMPRPTRGALRVLPALAVALVLGTAIAAAQLLPALAQIPASEAAADRTLAAGASQVGLLGDLAAWKELAVAVVPDFFGNPTWHVPVLPSALGYNEAALYIGSVPLLLAIVALLYHHTGPGQDGSPSEAGAAYPRHSRALDAPTRGSHILFFAGAALVALGMAVRLPVLGLLDNLPLLRITANGRLRFEYAFAMAMLSGYGLDLLISHGTRRGAWLLTLFWWGAGCLIATLGVALLLLPHPYGAALAPGIALHAAVPILWLTLFMGLLWLHRRGALAARMLSWLVPALAAVDLFVLGVGYHTTIPLAQATATPPAIRAIRQDHTLYRAAGLGRALLPALSSLYGLQDVRGYDPAYSADYERFFAAIFDVPPGMRLSLAPFGPSPAAARMLDLMNVKYLFAACSIRLNARVYHLVYPLAGHRDAACVYRNTTVLPRAFVVHSARWVNSAHAITLLRRQAVDLRSTVLLDAAGVDLAGQKIMPAPAPTQRETVQVTDYSLDRVDVAVHAAARGFLVLGDADAPGWQARIDGRLTPIRRADGVFRAVAIEPGVHQVRFTYEPQPFTLGVSISLAALGLWLLFLLVILGQFALRGRGQYHTTGER